MNKNPAFHSRLTTLLWVLFVLLLVLSSLALSPVSAQPTATEGVTATPVVVGTMTPGAAPTLRPVISTTATATPTLPFALRIVDQDPVTLDPALVADARSSNVVLEIFSGLVTLDRNLNVVPDIAQRWEIGVGNTVYTFTLRTDVRFHDGGPVTAQDFKYSIERAADPRTKSESASLYLGDIVGVNDKLNGKAASVDGVRVIDDHTLEIRINAPQTAFLAKLCHPNAFVVDKNNIERDGAAWTQKPNGTGPFKLKEYVPNQRLVLVRNDDYYLEPKPQIAQVNLTLTASATTYSAAYGRSYADGEVDAYRISPGSVITASNPAFSLNKQLVTDTQFTTSFIFLNTRMPPFDDPKVRQAFALAIDRRKLAGDPNNGLPLLAKSILPPGMPGYNDALPDMPFDPVRAKQLLAESKYAAQLPPITWVTSNSFTSTIQAASNMLSANLGISITVQELEWGKFINAAGNSSNPYQMVDYSWTADYFDPADFIAGLFRSDSASNSSGYANPDVDKLIDQAASEIDPNQRRLLYQQAEQRILQDLPAIPLFHDSEFWLVKPYVKGLLFPLTVIPRFKYVSLGW